MLRRPPRSTQSRSWAASEVYKRQQITCGWSGQLQRRLENGELDGMLAMGPAQQSFAEGYSGRLLCPLEVVPIAGRRLNLRASSLRECAERGWILNPDGCGLRAGLIRELQSLSLIHISEPTRLGMISYAVFCLKKKKNTNYLKASLEEQ